MVPLKRYYLDTSAAGKLLLSENESGALSSWADGDDVELVSSCLLETELRRIAARAEVPQDAVSDILDRVALDDAPPSLFREAGLLPGRFLRSLDAIHLATALRLGVDTVVTYDVRLAASTELLGMRVLAPR